MKMLKYIFGLFLILSIVIMCKKESDNNLSDNIKYIGTELGGCNTNGVDDVKHSINLTPDTIIFTVDNDTLDVYIGINYICCAPFTSSSEIKNDSIIMYVNDTCINPYQTCYCRCYCYYTFDFLFTSYEKKEYSYKAILSDPREDLPIIIGEGKIDLSNL